MSKFGVIARGVRMPIFKEGDNVAQIVCDNLFDAADEGYVRFKDNDIIAITESIVARADGNYVTVDNIATEIRKIFGEKQTIGVLWPIYSRNRFSLILKGIARGAKKVVVQLHNGKDEVGNDIVNQFTGVNIIEYYRELIESEKAEAVILQSEDCHDIVRTTNNVIIGTIHNRNKDYADVISYKKNYSNPVKVVKLDEICAYNCQGGNRMWGLLGSNKCGEEKLKLFPRDSVCAEVVTTVQRTILERTGKHVEVMIYGDGCFKDPVGGIWEFADPIVAPAKTQGLEGTPNELKLKYLVDGELADLDGEELENKLKKMIRDNKEFKHDKNSMSLQGTTPRNISDLVGSLCDLISGSGDRATPVVWIQNYFDKYCD